MDITPGAATVSFSKCMTDLERVTYFLTIFAMIHLWNVITIMDPGSNSDKAFLSEKVNIVNTLYSPNYIKYVSVDAKCSIITMSASSSIRSVTRDG